MGKTHILHQSYTTTDSLSTALPGVYIGQNAAGGYSDLVAATNGWHFQIVNFSYGVDTKRINGQYTQVGVTRCAC